MNKTIAYERGRNDRRDNRNARNPFDRASQWAGYWAWGFSAQNEILSKPLRSGTKGR